MYSRIARDHPLAVECASSGIGRNSCTHYPEEYAQRLWEERAQQYAHLPSRAEAAARLGYHPSTMSKLIRLPEVKAEAINVPLDWKRKSFRRALSDRTMTRLKQRKSNYASHEYFNAWQLKTLTGRSIPYIRRHLAEVGLVATPMRAANNQLVDYWPQMAIAALGPSPHRGRDYPPGGDWMTEGRIKETLHCGELWAKTRLKAESSEIRLDDTGRPRRHYSPQTYRRLEQAAKSVREVEHKSLLTVNDMAGILEVPSYWVWDRLRRAHIGWEPLRHNRLNYYLPRCLDWLKQQRARQLIQLSVAARQLDRDVSTVVKLLKRHPDLGKIYLLPRPSGKRGAALWCYITPATLRRIKTHYLTPPPHGWYTANQIAHQTGRSIRLVRKSLKAAGLEAQPFKTPEGQPSSYFPPGARNHVPLLATDKNDWYTIGAMARKLGRSWTWIDKHVRQEPFELRANSRQVITKHYRPCVYTRLRIISSAAPRPAQGIPGWYTQSQLCIALDRSHAWLQRHLNVPAIQQSAVQMPDRNGRMRKHYPPEVYDKLAQLIGAS